MAEETPMVQGEPTPESVSQETPSGAGVAPATPSRTPADAEALQLEFAKQQETLSRDLNKLKSTFQSREAQLTKEARLREEQLKQELAQTKMATMDEETRKTYEFELSRNRIAELEAALNDSSVQFETYRATQDAITHFKGLGVPSNILITDGTFDDLLKSGWDWVTGRLVELSKTPVNPPQAPVLPVAPHVDIGGSGTPPSTKPSWADIEKKYGTREKFYQLFQEGRIPPSAVPD